MITETKVSHTPGPWKTKTYQDDILIITDSDKGIQIGCVESYYMDIHKHDFTRAEMRATAKLIAAAPDLLKALQMLDECLSDGIPLEKNDPCHRRIKEEIQKATL